MEPHNWRLCKKTDCEDCQDLVDEGIVMACDQCDQPGLSDADGFTLLTSGEVVCQSCLSKPENSDAQQVHRHALGPAHDVLNRMRTAHKKGRGIRVTAAELNALSLTSMGELWEAPDPRMG
jgi:hypothetical protein